METKLFIAASRPWWSQPMCAKCYVARFGSECNVTANDRSEYKCFVCNEPTSAGIFLSAYPDMRHGKVALRKWLSANPDTRYAKHIHANQGS